MRKKQAVSPKIGPDPDFFNGLLSAILLVAGIIFFGLAFWIKKSIFRCHEMGVFQQRAMGERSIRYDQIDTFVYSAIRMYVNGGYQGTTLTLKFTAPATTITYNKQVKNVDDDLDNLRDHISGVVAGRMAEQFQQGGQVVWTPNITLRQDGIEYAPQGFLGRKDREVLPYDQIRGFNIQKGTFHLWNHEQQKSVMQENIAAPNFFPGFLLLVSMSQQQDEEE